LVARLLLKYDPGKNEGVLVSKTKMVKRQGGYAKDGEGHALVWVCCATMH